MTDIHFADDYENLASTVANHFGKPVDARIIRATMTGYFQETIEAIECNPHDFAATVNLYLLAKLDT